MRDTDENIMFSSQLSDVVFGKPDVLDLINDRRGIVFSKRLGTRSNF